MKQKDIYESFGITKKTAYNWQTSPKDSGRYLLYKVLERLPMEFVEETRKTIEAENSLSQSSESKTES